jgi:hypothetical protein
VLDREWGTRAVRLEYASGDHNHRECNQAKLQGCQGGRDSEEQQVVRIHYFIPLVVVVFAPHPVCPAVHGITMSVFILK